MDLLWYRPESPDNVWWVPWEEFVAAIPSDDPRRRSKEWDLMSSLAKPVLLVSEAIPYHPMTEHTALFREFASLESTEEAFRSFAQKYGSLVAPPGRGIPDHLNQWKVIQSNMRACVVLYDALIKGSVNDLPYEWFNVAELEDAARKPMGLVSDQTSFPLGSFLKTSRGGFIQMKIPGMTLPVLVSENATRKQAAQEILSGTVSSFLNMLHVSPAVARSEDPLGSGLELTFSPRDLAGAMFLQLALALDGNRTYDSCEYCGKWWDATFAHPSKKTCSDKCRQALLRKNKRKGGEAK